MIRTGIALSLLAAGLTTAQAGTPVALPGGTFVQLSRESAGQTADKWQKSFQEMKAIGIDTLIVQWTAQPGISYFAADEKDYPEQFDVVDRVLQAAEASGMSVYLGLQHDPTYWQQITGRDRVVKDYLYVRTAFNMRVHAALLKQFGTRAAWKGTYIPEEMDDLNWRTGERAALMRDYLKRLTGLLKRDDPERAVLVSTFYRLRTAPEVYAENLAFLTAESGVDAVLVQDGIGDGVPWKYAKRYAPVYYKALRSQWPDGGPALWAVVEVFERSTAENEAFAARTAPAERVAGQIELLGDVFARSVYFSYADYIAPDRSPAARTLYDALRKRKK